MEGGNEMLEWPVDCFPGTNLNDVNLDWIIDAIKQLDERVTALEDQNNGGG